MIKAVVFDFDGTLADTIPITISAIEKLAEEELHRKVPQKTYTLLKDLSIKEIILRERIPVLKLPYYAFRLNKMTAAAKKKADLFPGIKKMLSELSKNHIIGILTSSDKDIVQPVISRHGIENLSFVFTGSPLFGKQLTMMRMLLSTGLKKEEVIYVGDEIRDIQACRKAGIKIISVTWGYNSKKGLKKEKPDYIAESVRDIEKILAAAASSSSITKKPN